MTDWGSLQPDEGGIVALVAGVLLLLAGRKLYWVFVGLVGFLTGFLLVEVLLQHGPEWLALLAGLVVGAAAALLAVFFQKLAVALAGFLVAFGGVFWWASGTAWEGGFWVWVVALAAGLMGAVLTRWLFELALIVLSSGVGAALVVRAIAWENDTQGLAMLVLAGIGIVIQLWSGRRIATRRGRREA